MTDQTTPETPATASASAPPLLTEDDREALVDGLSDVIASWETDGYGPDAFAKFESIIEPLIRRHRAEAVAELRVRIEEVASDGPYYPGQCCPGYCMADVHDLRADQAERLRDVLRNLLDREAGR